MQQILDILNSEGLDAAIAAMENLEGYDREVRLYAVWCARQVEHLVDFWRISDGLNLSERYANGEISLEDLEYFHYNTGLELMHTNLSSNARIAAWGATLVPIKTTVGTAAGHAALALRNTGSTVEEGLDLWRAARTAQETELRRVINSVI